MKIGPPVDDLPPYLRHRGPQTTKYGEIWSAIKTAPPGKWIPVTCDSEEEARRIQTSIGGSANPIKVNTRIDGATLYVRRRVPEETPGRKPGPKAVPPTGE